VERRRGGGDVTGDSVGGGWVGEVEAKMRKVFTGGVVRGAGLLWTLKDHRLASRIPVLGKWD
jgi:hypothetical protein